MSWPLTLRDRRRLIGVDGATPIVPANVIGVNSSADPKGHILQPLAKY